MKALSDHATIAVKIAARASMPIHVFQLTVFTQTEKEGS